MAGARFSRTHRPEIVLIEGLDDATDLLPDVNRKQTRPPIAILAYTDTLPVRTLVYPFARYSPEYQAICWAHAHDVQVEFFDLPSGVFLGLQDAEIERLENKRREASERGSIQRSSAGRLSAFRSRRKVAVSADRRSWPASGITTPTGNATSNTTRRPTATTGRRWSWAEPCASWRKTHRVGGPRTSCAKLTCAAASRKQSRGAQAGQDRRRRRRLSRAGALRRVSRR